MKEEAIREALVKQFHLDGNKIKIPRPRRIFIDVDAAIFKDIFEYAVRELKFPMLCAITGLDEGATLGFIYHLASEDGVILNLKISVLKENPVIKTVTTCFPCADIYEREVSDLLGARVDGLAEGNRYPLMDEWPQGEHPLRKDWKPK